MFRFHLSFIMFAALISISAVQADEFLKYDAKRLSEFYAKREWGKATGELDKLLAVRPNDVSALKARCYCNIQNNKFDSALTDINRAIRVKANDPTLHLLRASVLKKLGKDELARADAQKVIALTQRASEASPVQKLFLSNKSGKATAANVIEKNHRFATKYETRHLLVFCDCDVDTTQSMVEPLEGFISYVDKNLCPLKGRYPLVMYVLKDENAMNAFFKDSLHETPSRAVFGMFFSSLNAVVTHSESGMGTLTHEIMHKVLGESVAELDAWAHEGIPTIFEKTYAYPVSSGWTIFYGCQNPWRLKKLDARWNELRLSKIVQNASTSNSDNESEERLVATFLNDNGKLQRYLELARNGDKKGFDTYLEAAFGSSIEQLEPRFQNYLRSIRARWSELVEIPNSKAFSTEAEYREFLKENAEKFKPIIPRS